MFEVCEYTSSRSTSNERNILNRIRNNVTRALSKHTGLPRLIVVVPDDDIITSIPDNRNSDDISTTKEYEHILNSIFNMIDRCISIYKDWLPAKCKREHIPHMLWMAPPSHKFFSDNNNEKRAKFTNALSAIVALHENTSMLRLVKFWDHNDSNLFLEEQYRYTSEGLNMYWRSIDAAIKFWFVAISRKFDKPGIKRKTSEEETPKSESPHQSVSNETNSQSSITKHYQDSNYKKKPTKHQYRSFDRKPYSNYDKYDNYHTYKWHRDDYFKSSRRLHYR